MNVRPALVAVAVLLFAPSARAEADDVARAQLLFEQAMTASRAQDYATACPKFAASQQLDPRTSTLLNLASCYELNGQTASAWATFKEARASALRYKRVEWADRAAAAIAKLEPMLVRLTVHVPDDLRAREVTVTLDGSALTANEWDQGIPVDPGAHRVKWAAPGHEAEERAVTVRAANAEITLTPLRPLPAQPVSTPEEGAGPRSAPGFWTTGRVVGVAVGSVGLATVATGGVFGLLAGAKYRDAENACGVSSGATRVCLPARSAEAVDARNSASELASASTVLFAAGGALVAGATVLFVTSRPRSGAPAPQVAVIPAGRGIAAVARW